MDLHFRGNSAAFHNAAFFCNVPEKDCQSAGFGIGVFNGAENLRVQIVRVRNVFSHSFSGNSGKAGVQQTGVCQLLHHCGNTTCLMQLFDEMFASRGQMAKIRGLFADFVEEL